MTEEILLKVGEIVCSVAFDCSEDKRKFERDYEDFLIDGSDSEATLNVIQGNIPDLSSWEVVFDSGGIWRLLCNSDQLAVSLQPVPYQAAIFQPGFERGDIFSNGEFSGCHYPPVERVLLEVFMVNLLARGRGVMLHACAVKNGMTGWLFVGSSGAGKSTMGELWAAHPGVTVLNDDRIILRKKGNRFWMYGTPWHGTFPVASPEGVPVGGVLFLQHDTQNRARRLNQSETVAKLLTCCFPTFWDADGMDFTLGALTEFSQALPFYELGFYPDTNVVDFVRCLKLA